MFQLYGLLPAFLLVLFRVSGLMLAAPFFAGAAIPTKIKVMLAAAISFCVFPMVAPVLPANVTLSSAIVGLVGELAIGLFVGLGVTLVFMGVQLAAQAVGQQSGMRLGAVFNPMMEASGTTLSQLYFLVSLAIFFAVGGHRSLVRTLLDSFGTIPPLGFHVSEGLVARLIDLLSLSFTLAIRVGGPTILALFLSLLVLGFVGRTMPQMNILTIGFPLKIGVALVVLAMTIMTVEPVLLDGLTVCMDAIREGLAASGANE